MALSKKDKIILKEDIKQLKEIAEIYRGENKIAKAIECLKEMEELKRKLEGE